MTNLLFCCLYIFLNHTFKLDKYYMWLHLQILTNSYKNFAWQVTYVSLLSHFGLVTKKNKKKVKFHSECCLLIYWWKTMSVCCTEVWVQVQRYITIDNLFSVVEALLLWTASKQWECAWHRVYVHKVLVKTDLGVKGEEGKQKKKIICVFRGILGLFREVLLWICSWTHQSDYITSKTAFPKCNVFLKPNLIKRVRIAKLK